MYWSLDELGFAAAVAVALWIVVEEVVGEAMALVIVAVEVWVIMTAVVREGRRERRRGMGRLEREGKSMVLESLDGMRGCGDQKVKRWRMMED